MKAFKKAEDFASDIREYIDTRVSLMKLQVVEKISRLIAWLIAGIILFFTLSCVVIFLSLAAAHGIGDALGKPWLGYLVVAGGYLLLGLLAWFGKGKLFRVPLMNAILGQIYHEKPAKDNEKD